MKRYVHEITSLLLQICAFYLLPLSIKTVGPFGIVLLILLSTFALSLFLGMLSAKRIKYLYPLIIAILFIPSVFLFYNESALIHAMWYLVISGIGIVIGSLIRRLFAHKQSFTKGIE